VQDTKNRLLIAAWAHTPRGLGLATATTSAAFFPHLEHRIRGGASRVVRAAEAGSVAMATPRGLGLATATTSAAFKPHLEQRIRSASSSSVIFQPTRRASACVNLRALKRRA
jgi:hypothetical protein